jgi:hypothetical protein
MKTLKITSAIIGGLIALAALAFYLQSLGFGLTKTFAPKYEAVRREVFEQSNAYNAGMIRDLENIELEYNVATPAGKAVLRAVAIHRFEVYPESQLTPDLRHFYTHILGLDRLRLQTFIG